MPVSIRANLALKQGCKLLYDPPIDPESYKSRVFFDKYRNQTAEFLGYSAENIGPLDHKGRLPGQYLNPKGIHVRFVEGGAEEYGLNIGHFIVIDTANATLSGSLPKVQRVGELPHPVLFYPDDMVVLKEQHGHMLPDVQRDVSAVFTTPQFVTGDIPRYEIVETPQEREARCIKLQENSDSEHPLARLLHTERWDTCNLPGTDIELVERGNVWALYHDASKLSFPDQEAESAFWARSGVSKITHSSEPLSALLTLFQSGAIDSILKAPYSNRDDMEFSGYRLHDCFSEHRERVRELTAALWSNRILEKV